VSTSNDIHVCPYCELVFSYHEEVKDHIVHDHPDHAAVVATVEMRELPHS
jgi:hypothetical protein